VLANGENVHEIWRIITPVGIGGEQCRQNDVSHAHFFFVQGYS
jgi:hypothetical protein